VPVRRPRLILVSLFSCILVVIVFAGLPISKRVTHSDDGCVHLHDGLCSSAELPAGLGLVAALLLPHVPVWRHLDGR
jgi:hypothetical protein